MTTKPESWGGMRDETVKKATGCDWKSWIWHLDKSGCAEMSHTEIAALVRRRWPRIGGWWAQMVTVGYEQAKGRRKRNQVGKRWRVSSSKTIAVPVKALFAAWKDARKRSGWLKDHRFTVRKAIAPRTMRITWVDGKTNVEAYFSAKGRGKSLVAVQHDKLASRREVERMRAYWGLALEKLKAKLEA